MRSSAVSIILFLLLPVLCQAEIYKWTDAQGRVHFGDKKPSNRPAEELELKINTYTSVSYDKSFLDVGNKVVMYSTSSCGYCKQARRYFQAKGIPFADYNIETSRKARAEFRKMGARGVPVILVGKKRLNGFSKKGFEAIYH